MEMKILVIEDSTLLQRMYEMIFRRYTDKGGQVIRALDGRQGIEQLYRHSDCSLVILDINMPEMTGIEFLERCRTVPRLRRIPKIIISTEGDDASIVNGLKAGADGYLVKPFKVRELHTLIERVLKARTDTRPQVMTA
jgi:DNA-binding response OmpR family regulator